MCSYFLTAFRSAGITLHKLKRVIYRYEYHLTLARWSYNLETKRHPRKRGMGKMAPAQPLERLYEKIEKSSYTSLGGDVLGCYSFTDVV